MGCAVFPFRHCDRFCYLALKQPLVPRCCTLLGPVPVLVRRPRSRLPQEVLVIADFPVLSFLCILSPSHIFSRTTSSFRYIVFRTLAGQVKSVPSSSHFSILFDMPTLDIIELNTVIAVFGRPSVTAGAWHEPKHIFLETVANLLGAFTVLFGFLSVKLKRSWYLGEACPSLFSNAGRTMQSHIRI